MRPPSRIRSQRGHLMAQLCQQTLKSQRLHSSRWYLQNPVNPSRTRGDHDDTSYFSLPDERSAAGAQNAIRGVTGCHKCSSHAVWGTGGVGGTRCTHTITSAKDAARMFSIPRGSGVTGPRERSTVCASYLHSALPRTVPARGAAWCCCWLRFGLGANHGGQPARFRDGGTEESSIRCKERLKRGQNVGERKKTSIFTTPCFASASGAAGPATRQTRA